MYVRLSSMSLSQPLQLNTEEGNRAHNAPQTSPPLHLFKGAESLIGFFVFGLLCVLMGHWDRFWMEWAQSRTCGGKLIWSLASEGPSSYWTSHSVLRLMKESFIHVIILKRSVAFRTASYFHSFLLMYFLIIYLFPPLSSCCFTLKPGMKISWRCYGDASYVSSNEPILLRANT